MYTHVWLKYLPVIRILLKKSAKEEQKLDLNRVDFERAGSGRKAGYKFTIDLTEGKVANVISGSPLAVDLAAVLLADEVVKNLTRNSKYEISLNTKFQLFIKNFTPVQDSADPGKNADNSGADTTE